jgi:hypothetical protein
MGDAAHQRRGATSLIPEVETCQARTALTASVGVPAVADRGSKSGVQRRPFERAGSQTMTRNHQ